MTKCLLLATVLLIAFEQVILALTGSDTIYKPYRVALIVLAALSLFLRPKISWRARRILVLIFFVYFASILVALFRSILVQINLESTYNDALLFGISFMLFTLSVMLLDSVKDVERYIFVIIISALLSTVLSLTELTESNFFRFAGFFRNPNHYAYMMGLTVISAVYLLFDKKNNIWLLGLLAACVSISLFFIYMSGSRGVMVAIAAVSILTLLQKYSRSQRTVTTKFIAVMAVISGIVLTSYVIDNSMVLFSDRFRYRYEMEHIITGSGRIDLWRAGLLAAWDSAFMGLGLGQYIENHYYYINQLSGSVYSTVLNYELGLHSEFINLFVEGGVILLGIYCYMLWVIWRGVNRCGRIFRDYQGLSRLVQSLIVFDIVVSLFQNMYIVPMHWIVLALGVSLINLCEKRLRRESDIRISTNARNYI